MSPVSNDIYESPPKSKRTRLSHACNLCRARKVRCDERPSSCRNCTVAGVQCVTTDPRRADGRPVLRENLRNQRTRSASTQSRDDFSQRPSVSAERVSVSAELGNRTSGDKSVLERLQKVEQHVQNLARGDANKTSSPYATEHMQLPFAGLSHKTPDQVHSESPNPLQVSQSLQLLPGISPEGAFHEDEGFLRRKWLGPSSIHVLTQWLDLSSTIQGGQPISSRFRSGMQHAEEVDLPLSSIGSAMVPTLPLKPERTKYLTEFFLNVHPISPLLDVKAFWAQVSRFDWLCSNSAPQVISIENNVSRSDIPILACIYAATSIGIDEHENRNSDMGEKYMKTAFSFYPHLIGMPYLASVQALLLIAIALRSRNKDGSAWHVVGHTVRMAQSLGLHLSRRTFSPGSDDQELDARVWWTIYVLEKIMSFETGRPSLIDDEDCTQNVPAPYATSYVDGNREVNGPNCFGAFIGLARVQNKISNGLFRPKTITRGPGQTLREVGRLDQELLAWLETVPSEIRPGRDLYCAPAVYPFAVSLSLQYHQTMCMLNRSGLLLEANLLKHQVKMYCSDSPWRHRLNSSEAICVDSAKAIIKLHDVENTDYKQTHMLLQMITPALVAFYVLAIHILRNPGARMAQANLMLLTTISHHVETRYTLTGQDPEFYGMLSAVCELAIKRVSAAINPSTTASIPIPNPISHHYSNSDNGLPQDRNLAISSPPAMNLTNWMYETLPDEFELPAVMEDLWPRVLGEDLAFEPLVEGGLGNSNDNLDFAYHLFGLQPSQWHL